MKTRAVAVLNAMRWPYPTSLFEADMVSRVPIARRVYRHIRSNGGVDPSVENGNHLVATVDGQRAARTEVLLHIDYDQGVTGPECFVSQCHIAGKLHVVQLESHAQLSHPPSSPRKRGSMLSSSGYAIQLGERIGWKSP